MGLEPLVQPQALRKTEQQKRWQNYEVRQHIAGRSELGVSLRAIYLYVGDGAVFDAPPFDFASLPTCLLILRASDTWLLSDHRRQQGWLLGGGISVELSKIE